MRGGTSRCLAFHERDLPSAGPERDRILLSALGSPDPYGRQLDGLGLRVVPGLAAAIEIDRRSLPL
jgi:2-methylaconitate cis-trans-isomerase PrpF